MALKIWEITADYGDVMAAIPFEGGIGVIGHQIVSGFPSVTIFQNQGESLEQLTARFWAEVNNKSALVPTVSELNAAISRVESTALESRTKIEGEISAQIATAVTKGLVPTVRAEIVAELKIYIDSKFSQLEARLLETKSESTAPQA